jgi:hypothetical protein
VVTPGEEEEMEVVTIMKDNRKEKLGDRLSKANKLTCAITWSGPT